MLLCQLDPPNTIYTHLSQALLFWLICHTYIKNRGLSVNPWPFPTVLTMKTWKKHCSHVWFLLLDIILAQWRCPVASSEALDLLHWAMCAVTYRCIAMAIKMATFLGAFVDCCLFAWLPWRPLGQYVASSCPMAASSGFQSSLGHAALGNNICIAPVHCRGHQNGRQTRCICSSLLILSSAITVAK